MFLATVRARQLMGRKWGRTQGTANQARRKAPGQLPRYGLVGWLKVEAQGCREGDNGPAHTTYPQGGDAEPSQPHTAWGRGAFG